MRIWPAMLTTIAASALIASLILPKEKFLSVAFAAAFGLSNYLLIAERLDYFHADALLDPYLHTWSLGVEIQAYLIMPFLISGALLCKDGRKEGKTLKPQTVILIVTAISIVFYLLLSVIEAPVSFIDLKDIGFYSMPSRFWEMGLGMLAYYKYESSKEEKVKNTSFFRSFSITGIIVVLIAGSPEFLDSRILLTALVYLLISVKPHKHTTSRVLKSIPVKWAGDRSYSIYLCHWPVICFTRWTFGVSSSTITYCILLTLLLSEIMYTRIESKYRYADGESFRGLLTILSISPIICYLISLGQMDGMLSFERLLKLPSHTKYQPECQGDERRFRNNTDILKCIGSKGTKTKLILVGDSHAGHFVPMLKKSGLKKYYDFRFINLATSNGLPNALWARRDILRSTIAQAIIGSTKSNDIVMISFYKEHLNNFRSFKENDKVWNRRMVAAKKSLSRLLEKLVERNVQVILVLDTPNSTINDIGVCIAKIKLGWDSDDCKISRRTNMRARMRQELLFGSSIRDINNSGIVYTWDPSVFVLGNKDVYFIEGIKGTRVFDDSNHISAKFSESLAPKFDEILKMMTRKTYALNHSAQ